MSVSDGIRFFKPLGELVRAMDRGWIRILVCRLLIHDEIREVLDNNIANYQSEHGEQAAIFSIDMQLKDGVVRFDVPWVHAFEVCHPRKLAGTNLVTGYAFSSHSES